MEAAQEINDKVFITCYSTVTYHDPTTLHNVF